LGLPYRNEKIHTHEVLVGKSYPVGVKVTGNLFDATPPHLVKAIITELGIIHPTACVNVMWRMKISKRISELMPDWAYGRL
jgi:translation initiation factor 2B subunit (eIF-2B alpha/beta/delta family)